MELGPLEVTDTGALQKKNANEFETALSQAQEDFGNKGPRSRNTAAPDKG